MTEAYNQRRRCCPRKGDDGIAHSFNCTPRLSDMHLADALVILISDFYGWEILVLCAPVCLLNKCYVREPDMQIDCFRRTLKTCLFDQYSAHRVH